MADAAFEMVTLETAAALYQAATVKQLRRRIAEGVLPASRAGRSYMVRLADVRALYAPQLRRAPARASRRTPSHRRAGT